MDTAAAGREPEKEEAPGAFNLEENEEEEENRSEEKEEEAEGAASNRWELRNNKKKHTQHFL